MLVERQPLRLFVEILEVCVKPVRKARVDPFDRFGAFVADGTARSGAAATGLMRDHNSDTIVEGARQERRLAKPRMPDGDYACGIDVGIGYKIIDDAGVTPRPGGDGAPVVLALEILLDPFAHVGAVRIDVARVERRHRVTAVDGLLNVPDVDLRAPARLGGTVVLYAFLIRVDPIRVQMNLRIVEHRVVAAKVHDDEHRRRPLALVWDDEQQMNLRPIYAGERERDLLESCLAGERLGIDALDLGVDLRR